MKRPALSLTKKALLAVAVIFLPVLFTFLHSYVESKDLIKNQIIKGLDINSESIQFQVYNYLEMIRRRNEDFASDGRIREGMESMLRNDPGAAGRLGVYLVRNKLPLSEHTRSIDIITLGGRVVASTDPSSVGKDVSRSPFFTNALSGVSFTEVTYPESAGPGVAVSTVLRSEKDGRAIGIITQFYGLSEISDMLSVKHRAGTDGLYSARGSLNTFEAYLVNYNGLMLTGSRFVKDAAARQKVATDPVVACLATGKPYMGFYRDYRGVEVAGAARLIKPLNWVLLVEIDSSEALLPTVEMRNDALRAALAMGATIALLLFLLYRQIILQIKRLSAAAAGISRGDYSVNIPVKTEDELGALTRSFNFMASEVRSRKSALAASEERLRAILNNSSSVIYLKDLEGRYIFINRAYEKLTGMTDGDFRGKTDFDIFPPEVARAFRESDMKVLEAAGPVEFEEECCLRDEKRYYISQKFPLLRPDGTVYAVCGFSTDITALRRAEEEMNSIAKFPSENPSPVLRVSPDGVVLYSNKAALPVLAELGAEVGGRLPEKWIKEVTGVRETKESREFVISRDDRIYSMIFTPAEGSGYVNLYGRDITDMKKAEFELKKLSMAIEQSVNIIFITDVKGVIEYVNPVFEQVTGYSESEAIGRTPGILSSGEVPLQKYEELWKTILSGRTWRSVLKNRRKDGEFFWVNSTISPIKDETGRITHFLSVQEDITARMASEERIRYLASNDELTGLVNRTKFIELLDERVSQGGSGALCFIDIDQFKLLNDSLGHGTGDEFLRRMALLFRAVVDISYRRALPGTDTRPLLSRLSGDEFAVFLPSASAEKALEVMEELRNAVEDFHFAGHWASSSVSVGIALFPDHGTDTRELLTRADSAMFRAKDLGRNRCHLFRPEDKDIENMHSRLSWKEKILKALREDRFEPWFQPILDLSDDTVRHYEVLARMRDEDGSVLPPGAFIDIAERFGLIGLIDRTIIAKAMGIQAEMSAQGKDLSFGINLSGKELGDEELLSFIKTRIDETGADPARLVFEITETAAIGDLERAIRFIKALKTVGARFALDDFGVGFTSFTYLKEMQVDYIKIDGSFIRKLHENPNDQIFVKAITDVARGLKIKSIAEFVETEESLKLLREFKVDFAQGYLIGRPGPALAARLQHKLKGIHSKRGLIRAAGPEGQPPGGS